MCCGVSPLIVVSNQYTYPVSKKETCGPQSNTAAHHSNNVGLPLDISLGIIWQTDTDKVAGS